MNALTQSPSLSEMRPHGGTAELFICGLIGSFGDTRGLSAQAVVNAISALPRNTDTLRVRIDSYGGDWYEGIAIYNELKRFPGSVEVQIDGTCASIASFIAMAGETIAIARSGRFMIHNPWMGIKGRPEDLRAAAAELEGITHSSMIPAYQRSGKCSEEIEMLLNVETWYAADEAVAAGFVDSILEPSSPTQVALIQEYAHGVTPSATMPLTRRSLARALVEHREALIRQGWILAIGNARRLRLVADCLEDVLAKSPRSVVPSIAGSVN